MAESSVLKPLQLTTPRRMYDITTAVGVISALAAYLYMRIETSKKTIEDQQNLQRKIDKINEGLAKVAANVAYLKSAEVALRRSTTNGPSGVDNTIETARTVHTTDARTDTNSKAIHHGANIPLSSAKATYDPRLVGPLTSAEVVQVRARWELERPAELTTKQERLKELIDDFRKALDYPFDDRMWKQNEEYWLRKQWEAEEMMADRVRKLEAKDERKKNGAKL